MPNPNLTAGPGRPKGLQNRITSDLKTMIREALENAGGIGYLTKQAEENPKAFLALLGRIIPIDVDVTKKSINVSISMYGNERPMIEHDEQLKLPVAQEAVGSIHQ